MYLNKMVKTNKKEGGELLKEIKNLCLKKCKYLLSKKNIIEDEVYSLIKLFFKGFFEINYELSFLDIEKKIIESDMSTETQEHASKLLHSVMSGLYSGKKTTQKRLIILIKEFESLIDSISTRKKDTTIMKESAKSILSIPFVKKLFIRKGEIQLNKTKKIKQKSKSKHVVPLTTREKIVNELTEISDNQKIKKKEDNVNQNTKNFKDEDIHNLNKSQSFILSNTKQDTKVDIETDNIKKKSIASKTKKIFNTNNQSSNEFAKPEANANLPKKQNNFNKTNSLKPASLEPTELANYLTKVEQKSLNSNLKPEQTNKLSDSKINTEKTSLENNNEINWSEDLSNTTVLSDSVKTDNRLTKGTAYDDLNNKQLEKDSTKTNLSANSNLLEDNNFSKSKNTVSKTDNRNNMSKEPIENNKDNAVNILNKKSDFVNSADETLNSKGNKSYDKEFNNQNFAKNQEPIVQQNNNNKLDENYLDNLEKHNKENSVPIKKISSNQHLKTEGKRLDSVLELAESESVSEKEVREDCSSYMNSESLESIPETKSSVDSTEISEFEKDINLLNNSLETKSNVTSTKSINNSNPILNETKKTNVQLNLTKPQSESIEKIKVTEPIKNMNLDSNITIESDSDSIDERFFTDSSDSNILANKNKKLSLSESDNFNYSEEKECEPKDLNEKKVSDLLEEIINIENTINTLKKGIQEIDSKRKEKIRKKMISTELEEDNFNNYLNNLKFQNDKNIKLSDSKSFDTTSINFNQNNDFSLTIDDDELYSHLINDAKNHLNFMGKRIKKLECTMKTTDMNYEESVEVAHFLYLSKLIEEMKYAMNTNNFVQVKKNYQKAIIVFRNLTNLNQKSFQKDLKKIYLQIKKSEEAYNIQSIKNVLQEKRVEV